VPQSRTTLSRCLRPMPPQRPLASPRPYPPSHTLSHALTPSTHPHLVHTLTPHPPLTPSLTSLIRTSSASTSSLTGLHFRTKPV
jgi:hypothetical protein